MALTCLPRCVSQCLRMLGPCFRHRHHLMCSWLLGLHLGSGDRANLKALSRHGPAHLAYQHYRRLLCTVYWSTDALLGGLPTMPCRLYYPPQMGFSISSATVPSRASGAPSIRWHRKPASGRIIRMSSAFASCS